MLQKNDTVTMILDEARKIIEERGEAGLRAMSREVVVSATSGLLRTPLDEPDATGKRWLRRLAFGGRDAAHAGAETSTAHESTAPGRA